MNEWTVCASFCDGDFLIFDVFPGNTRAEALANARDNWYGYGLHDLYIVCYGDIIATGILP